MARDTDIAWCDHTFNPVWGCTKVSEGCRFCYAERTARRFGTNWGPRGPRKTFGDKHWNEPRVWDRAAARAGVRRRVFCGSMCDWAEDHPTTAAQLPRLWALILETPNLDWLLLTKRPERIRRCLPVEWGADRHGWPNVWLGASIETNEHLGRAAYLAAVPAVVRFVSYEPALEPLALPAEWWRNVDWLIYGGESGHGHRPDDLAWALSTRRRCRARGVAFFYKQQAALRPGTVGPEAAARLASGGLARELPRPRRAPS